MRSRHELLVVAVAVCGMLGGTRLVNAQEAPPAAAPPAAAPAETAKPPESVSENEVKSEAKAEAEAEAEPVQEEATKPQPKAVGATPGRFEPTEKVRADFDVSFPIDI